MARDILKELSPEQEDAMTEPFNRWRAEIAEELEAARSELAAAQADYETKLFEVRAASAEKASIAKQFARLVPRQPAGALVTRRHGYEAALDAHAVALSRVTNQIASLRRRLSDLETAADQLDTTISPPSEDASDAAAD
jgi:chromosome segregation ATPase